MHFGPRILAAGKVVGVIDATTQIHSSGFLYRLFIVTKDGNDLVWHQDITATPIVC